MNLEERDKKVLIFGGTAAVVILLYALVLSPLLADLSQKRELMPKKEKDVMEMKALRTQYTEIQKQLQQVQAEAAKHGPILTEIENITKRANLSSKIVSLKPQAGVQTEGFKENIVEIKLRT